MLWNLTLIADQLDVYSLERCFVKHWEDVAIYRCLVGQVYHFKSTNSHSKPVQLYENVKIQYKFLSFEH